jgi:hypothetical protein
VSWLPVFEVGFKYYLDLHDAVDGRICVPDGLRIGHEVETARGVAAENS